MMSRVLPSRPSLEHLKKQAKDLVAGHRQGDPQVCATLRSLREFADVDDGTILAAPLSRAKAQLALALNYGFGGWNELRDHVLTQIPWDSIEGRSGLDLPELIIGNEVRFSTLQPAPDDFDAFTFFWLHPAMEHFDTRIVWSVVLPSGQEYVIFSDLLGAAGTSTRSDYDSEHVTGDAKQFRGKHIVEIFRSLNGRIRFGNAQNYRFVFYKKDREGQINWQRPYTEMGARIEPSTI